MGGLTSTSFVAGQERPPGSGRAPGTQNRRTALINAGLRSAVETLRHGDGPDPIASAFAIARLLEAMGDARTEALKNEIGSMAGAEFDRIVCTLKEAANIHLKLANYAFPKLRQHEYIGDAPRTIVQENKVLQFVLVDPHAKPAIDGRLQAEAAGDRGERILAPCGQSAGNGHAHDDDRVPSPMVLPGAADGDL